ncbi:MAG: hypothetical protein KDA58_06160 [Planctomycetaceae bacterium]|nr:hypothetical protein [Planctomycetaceae bacterium]
MKRSNKDFTINQRPLHVESACHPTPLTDFKFGKEDLERTGVQTPGFAPSTKLDHQHFADQIGTAVR